jgi:hypothetical protein
MKAPAFAKLFNGLPLLNQPQRQQVLAVLHPAAGLDRVIALIGEIRSKERCCPDCGSERCHRHGRANDLHHRRFREWLARFHGVASRWLPNYLSWYWAIDGGRVPSVEQLLRIAFKVINR